MVRVDGATPIESSGWLVIDGGMLIWGHDKEVGEYESATLFSKAQ